MNKKPMIKVELTKDRDVNREAIPPRMMDELNEIQKHFGPCKLVGFSVEQGSDAANHVQSVLLKHRKNDKIP